MRLKDIKEFVHVHTANNRQSETLGWDKWSSFLVASMKTPERETSPTDGSGNFGFWTLVESPLSPVVNHWAQDAASGLLCFRAQKPPLRLIYLIKILNSSASLHFREAVGRKGDERHKGELLWALGLISFTPLEAVSPRRSSSSFLPVRQQRKWRGV